MKKKILIVVVLIINSTFGSGQDIPPAPEHKAIIYFVRSSSLGFAINFTYFDSAAVIGRFNGPKYVRYECEPGNHLFWARSENRDFVEAEVEAGKIYFIEAVPQMGGIKAGVKLLPVNPTDEKVMKRIFKLMNKKKPQSFTTEELEKETINFKDVIERGLEKYSQEKEGGKKIARLEKTMHFVPAGNTAQEE